MHWTLQRFMTPIYHNFCSSFHLLIPINTLPQNKRMSARRCWFLSACSHLSAFMHLLLPIINNYQSHASNFCFYFYFHFHFCFHMSHSFPFIFTFCFVTDFFLFLLSVSTSVLAWILLLYLHQSYICICICFCSCICSY